MINWETGQRNNLQILDAWFIKYKGLIYANKPLDVNTRINNKVIIDGLHGKNQYKIDQRTY